jgi:hypothetical protein
MAKLDPTDDVKHMARSVAQSRLRLENLRERLGIHNPVTKNEEKILEKREKRMRVLVESMAEIDATITGLLLRSIAKGFTTDDSDDAENAVAAAVIVEFTTW